MSKPVSGLNVFQNQAGPIPLSQLDSNFTLQTAALNDTATYSNYFADASGAANTITVTVSAPLTFAYVTGILLQVKLANTNTSTTVNLNVNALGNKSVILNDGVSPPIGALLANSILELQYDGTSFRVLNQSSLSLSALLLGDGSAGAPSSSYLSDPNTGTYRVGADNWGVSTGGTLRFDISTTAITSTLPARGPNGSVGAPAWSFSGDPDTGFLTTTANVISIALGGVGAGGFVQSTFTGTLTGMTSATTGTVKFYRSGHIVCLWISADILGTSNTTSMTMTGLPADCQPTSQQVVPCINLRSDGASASSGGLPGLCSVVGSTITFGIYVIGAGTPIAYQTSNFSLASGTKGLQTGWCIVYSVG